MAENLNNTATMSEQKDAEQTKSVKSEHHHHHHHSSSSDGHHHHHHHHHHSGVKVVTGNNGRRLPWITGLGMILICVITFFVLVMCTKIMS